MKVCKSGTDEIVGHLPMEKGRITKFIMDRGASATLSVKWKHYWRSSLIQGGLEVPCEVTVTMSGSVVNNLLLTRYEKLLNELYIKPENEEIVGTFFSVANEEEKIEAAKKQQEKKSEIKRHLGYVTKPKIKKGWNQENYCTWLAYICRSSAITLFKSNFSFCVFQGWKNCKILAFRDFFAGNNFRDCRLKEYFAGIWFCEFDQISTLKLLKSMHASG